ncbi:MAG: hypothetical protein DRJ31_09605 [Candidatus Methanomethylicota archaeon]|uniref:Uncharacterized protein n=1 Tax=Thermoproteota archaeon TaxID=2056631 RepID=A0A497EKM4_9CREN|nr:MAG: hypothetical protein DRJ31_09605 [Candidatus Verstraetearchaeota archaeon]
MRREAELAYRMLSPYVDRLAESLFTADINLEDASLEALSEIICFRIELSVRRMVRELNGKMRRGELEALRQLIRENPEAARKASRYVAKRLKYRVRRIIEEELGDESG